MKKLKAPSLAVIIILLNVSLALADTPTPPEPTAKTAAVTAGACPTCPGGSGGGTKLPINQNLIFLAISGLALGLTVIYRNHTKKASV